MVRPFERTFNLNAIEDELLLREYGSRPIWENKCTSFSRKIFALQHSSIITVSRHCGSLAVHGLFCIVQTPKIRRTPSPLPADKVLRFFTDN